MSSIKLTTALALLLIGSALQAKPNVDPKIYELLETQGTVLVSAAIAVPSLPFSTRIDFDAQELFRKAFPEIYPGDKAGTPAAYSDIFKKSFAVSPAGGYFSADITRSDLAILAANESITQLDAPLSADYSLNEAYDNTQSESVRNNYKPTLDGSGVGIAVLDGNIRTAHDSFLLTSVVEYCYSTTNDCSGQSHTLVGKIPIPVSGSGMASGPTLNTWAHGTGVFGTLASSNPLGPAPLSPVRAANFFAYRISGTDQTPAGTYTAYRPDLLFANFALEHIYTNRQTNGIKVVNMSFGLAVPDQVFHRYRPCDFALNAVSSQDPIARPTQLERMVGNITLLTRAGILVTAATGNNRITVGQVTPVVNSTNWPSCFSQVVSVSSSIDDGLNEDQNVAAHQRSPLTKIAAPGQIITTPWSTYDGTTLTSTTSNAVPGGSATSGTSFSAPIAAACVAQLYQKTGASPGEITTALTRSGDLTLMGDQSDIRLPAVRCENSLALLTQPLRPTLQGYRFANSGVWYNPSEGGQGFVLEVNNNNPSAPFVFGGWYTYAETGSSSTVSQRWMTIQTEVVPFNPYARQIDVVIRTTIGGRFDGTEQPALPIVGSGYIRFDSCRHGVFHYNSVELDGVTLPARTIPIERIYPSIRCHENDLMQTSLTNIAASGESDNKKFAYSGTYTRMGHPYDGIVMEINPAAAHQKTKESVWQNAAPFISWYTYSPTSPQGTAGVRKRWFTMQERLGASAADTFPFNMPQVNLDITSSVGPSFGAGGGSQVATKVGEAVIQFDAETPCSKFVLTYSFTSGEFNGISGNSTFVRVGTPPAGC